MMIQTLNCRRIIVASDRLRSDYIGTDVRRCPDRRQIYSQSPRSNFCVFRDRTICVPFEFNPFRPLAVPGTASTRLGTLAAVRSHFELRNLGCDGTATKHNQIVPVAHGRT
jgi:hypothetical protein